MVQLISDIHRDSIEAHNYIPGIALAKQHVPMDPGSRPIPDNTK